MQGRKRHRCRQQLTCTGPASSSTRPVRNHCPARGSQWELRLESCREQITTASSTSRAMAEPGLERLCSWQDHWEGDRLAFGVKSDWHWHPPRRLVEHISPEVWVDHYTALGSMSVPHSSSLTLLPCCASQLPWTEQLCFATLFCCDIPTLEPAYHRLNPRKPWVKLNQLWMSGCVLATGKMTNKGLRSFSFLQFCQSSLSLSRWRAIWSSLIKTVCFLS